MQKTLVFSLLLFLATVAFAQVDALMPQPTSLSEKDGKFRITEELNISVQAAGSNRLMPALERFRHQLSARTGMAFNTKVNDSQKNALTVVVRRVGGTPAGSARGLRFDY